MPQKSIDDLRDEMGFARLNRTNPSNNYVLLHLAFRLKEADARRLLKRRSELEISESIFARQAILERLGREK